jgi:hypothetical protein
MTDVFITAIVFFGIYQLIKVFTDYLLKRKIIITGNLDKTGILDTPKDKEENSYPTLKWGLVTLFAGAGLLIIALIDQRANYDLMHDSHAYLPFGIELIAISLGFLLYFIFTRFKTK